MALGQPGPAFPLLSLSHLVSLVLSVLLTLVEDTIAPSVQRVLLAVSIMATTHISSPFSPLHSSMSLPQIPGCLPSHMGELFPEAASYQFN